MIAHIASQSLVFGRHLDQIEMENRRSSLADDTPPEASPTIDARAFDQRRLGQQDQGGPDRSARRSRIFPARSAAFKVSQSSS